MVAKITTLAFLLFLSVSSFTQVRGELSISSASTIRNLVIKGRVMSSVNNQPLPGASISVVDDRIGTIAGTDGNYIIKNVAAGHHVIEVSHAGYATIVEHIELTSDLEKDFVLSPVITENQGVIVTGVTSATSIRKSPVPVSILRKQVLQQIPSTNIIDALSKVPGVSQITSGPAISKPVIRGLGYNRIVTVNEGTRQEGQQWGDEHGIEIDEMSVNRVEILKGPASLMYGSDALAGVINIITNIPAPQQTLRGNILTNFQSNNGLIATHANISANSNGFNWNVYGTFKSAGDYRNKYDGRVLNSRFNEKNAGGYFGWNKSWGYTHFIASRFDQRVGMTEGERDDATGNFILYGGTPLERIATSNDLNERNVFIPYQRVIHHRFVTDNSFVLGASRLKMNLGYQVNTRKEFGDAEDPSLEELHFRLGTFNYNLNWQMPELKEWHTTIGVNGMSQKNENFGEESLIPEYTLFDIGGFVFAQRFFRKATFTAGARFDSRTINGREFFENAVLKFAAFKKSFSNFSASAGLSYELSQTVSLKANLARGFRSPTIAELASNGTHEGTNRYEYGSTSLKSETSLQGDLGLELNFEHFNISLTGFYNHVNDFIFYRKLESVFGGDSLVNVDGEDLTAFRFDQSNASLRGVEATIDIHPHPLDWLHFENTFSFVRGTFDESRDGSINLPMIPAPRFSSELRGNFTGKNSLKNIYARLELQHNFEQSKAFTGYNTETPTKAYSILNAGVGADISRKDRTLFSIHLAVTNITDAAYQNHLNRLKYAAVNNVTGREGVFNMGRNFSVRLNIPFERTLK